MPYNTQQYVDEVKVRLSRYAVNQTLDEGSLEMIVNRARIAVQRATMPLFPERYSAILRLDGVAGNAATLVAEYSKTVNGVTNRCVVMNLPQDFIQDESVRVRHNELIFEARQLSKKELASVMNNSWSQPTPRTPVYCIEKDPSSATYRIFVSKGNALATPADVTIWYNKALKYLQLDNGTGNPDQEVVMSYEFEEFVVYQAMLDSLAKESFQNAKQVIGTEIETLISGLEMQYNTAVDRSGLLLPSRESIYPNQPVVESPGNMVQQG